MVAAMLTSAPLWQSLSRAYSPMRVTRVSRPMDRRVAQAFSIFTPRQNATRSLILRAGSDGFG